MVMMNIFRNIVVALALLLFTIPGLVHAGDNEYPVWDFKYPGDLQGWTVDGIRDSGIDDGAFVLIGEKRVQLRFPPGLAINSEKDNYLRLRLRIYSPRLIQVFWATQRSEKQLPAIPFYPHRDQHLHTYWIDLSESLEWIGKIDLMGLAFFGAPGRIDIDSIEIRPFSLFSYISDQWHEFWLPRTLLLGTINSLSSPYIAYIGGWSLVSLLNLLVVIVLVIAAVFYSRSSRLNRRQIVIAIALVFLCLWIAYDLRETYSQFKIAEEIYNSHIKPPPDQRNYPALGDFYRFVELCRKHLPPDAQYHYYKGWPFDCRIRYSLYPMRGNHDTFSNIIDGEPIPYHLVYQSPEVSYDMTSRRLIYNGTGEGFFISAPGQVIARMGPGTYIFKED